jgi:cell division protein FtsQ
MRKIGNILLVLLPLLYIFVTMGFITNSGNKVICNSIDVQVIDSLTNTFIEPNDILLMLKKGNVKILGEKLNSLNAQDVEDFIDKHPSILKSECYKTIGGTFRIDIRQRRPLLRVVSDHGNFYIDSNGEIMPFSKHYTAFVPVVSGNVKDSLIIDGLFKIGIFLDNNAFWRSQISQIEVKDDDDIMLIPRVGNHVIEFGSIEKIDKKFQRLEALYKEKFNSEGWNRYKKISVKFENQVVCTKK